MSNFPFMTREEVCEYLCISTTTLYRLQSKQVEGCENFPSPIKMGSRRCVFDTEEIKKYIEEQKSKRD